MQSIIKLINLPNLLTLGNLASGCAGIKAVIDGNYDLGYIYIFVAVTFDFFDGFSARMLKINSEIGKQLDSLADVVSFGVLPSFIMFEMIRQETENMYIPYVSFFLAMCAALRLAKFNIDDRQDYKFYGLPTPASALLICTLPYADYLTFSLLGLFIITIAVGLLMISDVPLLSFKFRSFGLKENLKKYILIVLFLILIAVFNLGAVPLSIMAYVFLSELKINKMNE